MFICPTLCGACQFLDDHRDPPMPHTWGGDDDFVHAYLTHQLAPGFCGCECGQLPRDDCGPATEPGIPDDPAEIRRRVEELRAAKSFRSIPTTEGTP